MCACVRVCECVCVCVCVCVSMYVHVWEYGISFLQVRKNVMEAREKRNIHKAKKHDMENH